MEYQRAPIKALLMDDADVYRQQGEAMAPAVKATGQPIMPVVVTFTGYNEETFEPEFLVIANHVSVVAASIAGVENVAIWMVTADEVPAIMQQYAAMFN